MKKTTTKRAKPAPRKPEAETLFQTLAKTASSPIFIYRKKFLYVNKAAEKLTGYSNAELLKMNFWDVVHPEYRALIKERGFARQRGEPVPQRYEFKIVTKKGEERWVDFTATAIDYEGEPAAVGTVFDITGRRSVEEAYRQSISLLSATLESTADGILVVDAQGKITSFNRKFADMWRIPESILKSRDDAKALAFVLDQLKEPEKFLAKVKELYATPDASSFDVLEFKDERVFERYSLPQILDGKSVGRVWSFRDVTDRKRSDLALLEAYQFNEQVISSAGEGIVVYDDNLRVLIWNSFMEQMTGMQALNVIGQRAIDIFPHVKKAGIDKLMRRALAGEFVKSGDIFFEIPKTGKSGWYVGTYVPHRNSHGETIGVIGVIHDLTQRKHAEEARRTSEEALQTSRANLLAVIENTKDAIWSVDRQYRIVTINSTFKNFVKEMFGITYDVGTVMVDPPTPPDVARLWKQWLDRSLDGEHFSTEYSFVPSRVDVEISLNPIFGELGSVEGVSIFARDISERKKSEKALRDSEARYRRYFDDDISGIFVSTPSGQLLDCNPTYARLLGFASIQDALNTNTYDMYERREDRDAYLALLKERKRLEGYERQLRRKDGKRITVISNIAGEFDAGGNLLLIRGYIFDITELRRLEEDLRHAQKMESVGTLAGGMAHDFNNILGIIIGYARRLESGEPDKDKVAQSVESILKAAERGAGLVRQLLTFARRSTAQAEPISVNEMIHEMSKIIEETFPKTVSLQLQLADEIPAITADPNQLHQALLNLCLNSRDAMPNGGTLTLATGVASGNQLKDHFADAKSASYVRIQVSDTGMGMTRETKSRIFEPFFSTKERGKGTGLGLAVVYGVVRALEGFVNVESLAGKGTTFSLYLPVQPEVQATRTPRKEPGRLPVRGRETVLLVEDEDMLLDLLSTLLSENGYRTLTARDGQEAVEIFKRHHREIAIVLSDMGLPKLGGWQAFQMMREVNPTAKVILASGYLDPNLRTEMIASGAVDFIQKPYIPDEVLRRIRTVIDQA
jgi:PAS domain S-box-containing protein